MRTRAIALVIALAAGFARAAVAGPEPVPDMEREVARRIDEIRRDNRLPPLRLDDALGAAAREYSCALARREALSHTDPAGRSVADRVRKAGKTFRVLGENLASSENARDPVAAAVQGWMQSSGHRKNILTVEFTETGVGVCRDGASYWLAQLFLGN
jgi:uncharacterized protein YkwD